MHKKILSAAAITGGSGVILGAFGAHGLQKITVDDKILHSYHTAVQYQVYHALALLALAVLALLSPGKWVNYAFFFFCLGILLFSGSLYGITYIKLHGSGEAGWLGPVTPVGGLFFILGWCCLLGAALSSKGSKR